MNQFDVRLLIRSDFLIWISIRILIASRFNAGQIGSNPLMQYSVRKSLRLDTKKGFT